MEVSDVLLIVMRVYFEKPRTTVGWKGLINDPDRDDSFDMVKGIRIARTLLRDISEIWLPVGTKALDPLMPQYLGDLVSWNAIGARTTESQTHREMASGLSTPVGLKNGTDGSLSVAINAIQSASTPHAFLGIDADGQTSLIRTAGNPYGHLILRGGLAPNYNAESVAQAEELLNNAGLVTSIVVDCSHGNSEKNHARQSIVLQDVMQQIKAGNRSLVDHQVNARYQRPVVWTKKTRTMWLMMFLGILTLRTGNFVLTSKMAPKWHGTLGPKFGQPSYCIIETPSFVDKECHLLACPVINSMPAT